jgi:hypothetical protein
MPEDLDINKIVVESSFRVLENTYDAFKGSLQKYFNRNKLALNSGFKSYLDFSVQRVRQIPTVLSEQPEDLINIYVPVRFKSRGSDLGEAVLRREIERAHQGVVVGVAGSGKTLFLKRHFLHRLEEGDCIPLLYEMRQLNDADESLEDAVYEHMRAYVPILDRQFFSECLATGRIELLLDGFDEVQHHRRRAVGLQLLRLVHDKPRSRVLMTTRPDDRYGGWGDLHTYSMLPMEKHQVLDLLDKVAFDDEVRLRFRSEVDRELYARHDDFLSNPLLTTIMLLTYRRFAEVPRALHIFYGQAFDALYRRHDAAKPGLFRREMYTRIQIDEFQRMLSHLCAVSYAAERLAFSETGLLDGIRAAAEFENLKVDPADFKDDLIQSVCLMMKDGTEYRFVHRSFQEYFAALFIASKDPNLVGVAIDAIKDRASIDSVVRMAYQMNPAIVEAGWVNGALQALCSQWAQLKGAPPLERLSMFFEACEIGKNDIAFVITRKGVGANLAPLLQLLGPEALEDRIMKNQWFLDLKECRQILAEERKDRKIRELEHSGMEEWLAGTRKLRVTLDDVPLPIAALKIWSEVERGLDRTLASWAGDVKERVEARSTSALQAFVSATNEVPTRRRT